MNRTLLLLSAAAVLAVVGLAALAASTPTVHAQPPVCMNLAPGEHTISAPARDREGEVQFQLTIGEGGVVTAFTEPGGQSIPPGAVLEIFAGADAYPLPEGVAIVECAGGDMMSDDEEEASGPAVCLNLEPGTHTATVSAAGQSYEVTLVVGHGGQVHSVDLLGQTYTPADALALLEQFGATLPDPIQIVPCEASDASADAAADAAAYPTTGSGGLADRTASADRTSLWAALGALTAVSLVTVLAARRRVLRAARRVR